MFEVGVDYILVSKLNLIAHKFKIIIGKKFKMYLPLSYLEIKNWYG